MKMAVVVGTRPEIIKMSPIVRECENRGLDYFILHTGQHYSYNMDQVFFEQLELPKPRYNLDVGSGNHGEQTGKILIEIEKVLLNENPDVVLVEGDTNTVVAGALAASKLHIKVGHVEAGLRSYDRSMPEEINRVVADHISDFLFAPTKQSKQILIDEGVEQEKIFVTGNTIVDSVYQNLELADKKRNMLKSLGLQQKKYFLVTTHRQENVDDKKRFKNILQGLNQLSENFDMPVVYPIHPRSRKMMNQFGFDANGIKLVEPADFLGFLQLENNACLVLTDSGGVQEETCILGRPCVTLRDNTERPETLDVGSNMLAGAEQDRMLECVSVMLEKDKEWSNPFGDGTAGKEIIDVLEEKI
ncbi:MAG: non-hydrolyzing UDP-N-acetylglucosamine 2-epimerase [Petrotogales bacterium]